MIIRNRPVRRSLSDYHDAIGRYVDKVKTHPDVRSVALVSNRFVPGISDIDFVVVTEDRFPGADSAVLSTRGIDDNLFLHGPIVVPVSLLERVQWICYVSGADIMHGRDTVPMIAELPESVRGDLSGGMMMDFAESRFVQYAEVRYRGEIDQRAWMTRTWSVKHSVDLLRAAASEKQAGGVAELLGDVAQPRDAWRSGEDLDDGDFFKAMETAEEINCRVFLAGLESYYGTERPAGSRRLVTGNKAFEFTAVGAAPSYALNEARILGRVFRGFRCVQDPRYALHLQQYLPTLGYGNRWFTRADAPNHEVFRRRARFVVEHWAWRDANVPLSGSMAGYLGVLPRRTSTVKQRVRDGIQRVLTRM